MNVEKIIFDYINEHFEIDNDPDFTEDVNLFDAGFVDSLGAVEILDFAEQTFNVTITQKDITLFPMNTVKEIASVIKAKL